MSLPHDCDLWVIDIDRDFDTNWELAEHQLYSFYYLRRTCADLLDKQSLWLEELSTIFQDSSFFSSFKFQSGPNFEQLKSRF